MNRPRFPRPPLLAFLGSPVAARLRRAPGGLGSLRVGGGAVALRGLGALEDEALVRPVTAVEAASDGARVLLALGPSRTRAAGREPCCLLCQRAGPADYAGRVA